MPTSFPMPIPNAPTGFVNQAALDAAFSIPINDLYALLSTVTGGMDSGQVGITPSGVNTPTSVAITFNKTFTSAPKVMVTPNTTAAGTQITGWGASSITTTGCLIWVTRTNITTSQMMWLATLTQ